MEIAYVKTGRLTIYTRTLLDDIPFWAIFLLIALIILLSFEGGVRLGKYRRMRSLHEVDAPVGSAVGAILALLAFLLGFTFSIAGERFEARRNIVLEEANAIGTTYLRAGYLQEPYRTEIRNLLREYVTVRVKPLLENHSYVASGSNKVIQVENAIKKSEEIQVSLWAQATILAEKNSDSVMIALFIQSLNQVIDLHSKRVIAGLWTRIPIIIWLALFFLAFISMGAMGYHSGLIGVQSIVVSLAVILSFSAVMVLIIDLDRPWEGFLQVSQHAMEDLMNKISLPTPSQ